MLPPGLLNGDKHNNNNNSRNNSDDHLLKTYYVLDTGATQISESHVLALLLPNGENQDRLSDLLEVTPLVKDKARM